MKDWLQSNIYNRQRTEILRQFEQVCQDGWVDGQYIILCKFYFLDSQCRSVCTQERFNASRFKSNLVHLTQITHFVCYT